MSSRNLTFVAIAAAAITLMSSTLLRAEEGVPLHGFADIVGGSASPNTPLENRTKGVGIGTFDLYLTPEFGSSVKSLFEIALEADAGNGGVSPDVERSQLGYAFSDLATLWVGRFHTPYGFWNTGYHHGAQLQPSIYRPRFLDFEDKGGFLPAHSVGMWLHGFTKSESLKLTYDLYTANGPRVKNGDSTAANKGTLDQNNIKNDKDSMAFGGNLYLTFAGSLDGLTIGAHGYQTEVDTYSKDDYDIANILNYTSSQMVGGWLMYDNYNIELIGEYYRFSDKSLLVDSAKTYNSEASYVYLAYQATKSIKPYGRYERAIIDANDPYFANLASGKPYFRYVGGIRFDIDEKSTVKLESIQTTDQNTDGTFYTYNKWMGQFAVRF